MASKQTANYGLNQWEAGDQVLRTEFNADNAKIDAAIKQVEEEANRTQLVAGVLNGYDGSAAVTVELEKQPKLVIVGNKLGFTNIITNSSSSSLPGHAVAMPEMNGYISNVTPMPLTGGTALTVTETGFTLKEGLSASLAPYFYLALL